MYTHFTGLLSSPKTFGVSHYSGFYILTPVFALHLQDPNTKVNFMCAKASSAQLPLFQNWKQERNKQNQYQLRVTTNGGAALQHLVILF